MIILYSLSIRGQNFNTFQTIKISEECTNIISEYTNYAGLIGDINSPEEDLFYFKKDFFKLFENKSVYVYNDLDPEQNTSDMLKISEYIDYLEIWYPTGGMTTKIDEQNIMLGEIKRHQGNRYYVNVYVEKKVSGFFLDRTINQQNVNLEIRIAFRKNNRSVNDFKIVGINKKGYKFKPEPEERDIPNNMVFVKGGTFQMGSNENSDEKPIHTVRVSDFYMGKYEVTVKEFKIFIDKTSYKTDADKKGKSWVYKNNNWQEENGVNWRCDVAGNRRSNSEYNHPVIHVSWNDAKAYVKWLSKETGKNCRLPTEAEWQYAARGGNKSRGYKYSGSSNIDEVAWYSGNSGSNTHSVGNKKSNELGIYDMSGNVWEWVEDKWHSNYEGAPTDGSAWTTGNSSYRVCCGGSWDDDARYCRSSVRYSSTDYISYYSLGFRFILVL